MNLHLNDWYEFFHLSRKQTLKSKMMCPEPVTEIQDWNLSFWMASSVLYDKTTLFLLKEHF